MSGLSGVILNKAGSERHAREIAEALQATGLEVLECCRAMQALRSLPAPRSGTGSRACGSSRGGCSACPTNQPITSHSTRSCRSHGRHRLLAAEVWSAAAHVRPPSDARPVVAVAAGRAFTFRYAETDELLRAAGCEAVIFDPISDT